MVTRHRYRLRPGALGLPLWGWALAGLAVVVGVVGLAVAVAGSGALGAVLMGGAGIVLSMCVLVGMATDEGRTDRSS